jgi:hypothetical protein
VSARSTFTWHNNPRIRDKAHLAMSRFALVRR